MSLIPEPTPFCLPPPGAPLIQHVAIYAHWISLVAAALATVYAFRRATRFAPVAHFMIATGLLLVTGAVFAGETLYANLIYEESVRALPEVRLALFGFGAASVATGFAVMPGLTPKRFPWLRAVAPGLLVAGFLAATLVQRVGGAWGALAIAGGVAVVAAGALALADGRARGVNRQERAMSAWGCSLVAAGLAVAVGGYCSASDAPVMWDRGALLLTAGEGAFALFVGFALASVEVVAPAVPAPTAAAPLFFASPVAPLPPPPGRGPSREVPPPPNAQ